MVEIYDDIKQKKPFDRPEREVAVTLVRTSEVVRHVIERALAPWKVSPEQYNVLRILRGAGPEGHPTLRIADRMLSRSPNITRLLDKLIDKNLAQRDRPGEDRRLAVISITSGGRDLLEELDAVVDEALKKFRCLTEDEMRLLVGLLDRIRGRLAVKTARELSRRRANSPAQDPTLRQARRPERMTNKEIRSG